MSLQTNAWLFYCVSFVRLELLVPCVGYPILDSNVYNHNGFLRRSWKFSFHIGIAYMNTPRVYAYTGATPWVYCSIFDVRLDRDVCHVSLTTHNLGKMHWLRFDVVVQPYNHLRLRVALRNLHRSYRAPTSNRLCAHTRDIIRN